MSRHEGSPPAGRTGELRASRSLRGEAIDSGTYHRSNTGPNCSDENPRRAGERAALERMPPWGYRALMANFRVAFVQGRPRFGQVERNIERGLALAATVDADLVVLPELWSSGYVFSSHAEVAALAEDAANGATARALQAAARRERRHYVAGFPERHRGRYYNSALLVGPAGVKAVYRKLHLFEREQEWFEPGDIPLAVHRVGPARVGMLICFDWRFPETARVLALLGADVIAHPSNLVYANAQEAMRVRALENRLCTATANRTGTETRPGGSVPFTGRSQIVGPDGLVLVRARKTGDCAMAVEVDISRCRDKALSPLTHLFRSRRPAFYRELTNTRPGR